MYKPVLQIHKMWGARGAPERLQARWEPERDVGKQRWGKEINQHKPASELNQDSVEKFTEKECARGALGMIEHGWMLLSSIIRRIQVMW